MFGNAADEKPLPKVLHRIDSLIGPGSHVEGEVTFTGGLRVDGRICGNVVVPAEETGTLAIGEFGVVDGDVRVTHLVVDGTINGSVYVEDFVELRPKARVTGDVHAGTLEMQSGAVVDGHVISRSNSSVSSV